MSEIPQELLTQVQWIFSGIGVTAALMIIGIVRWLNSRRIDIDVFQEGDDICAINCSQVAIKISRLSVVLTDILAKPEFARADSDPIFRDIHRPIASNDKLVLLSTRRKLFELATIYSTEDRESFHQEHPEFTYPIFLGIVIRIDCNRLPSGLAVRKTFRFFLTGDAEAGVGIMRNPYGPDSGIPWNFRVSDIAEQISRPILHPRKWWAQKKAMKSLQSQLNLRGVFRALKHNVISRERAACELKKLYPSLNEEDRTLVDTYLDNEKRTE